jgi:hypothetical protein
LNFIIVKNALVNLLGSNTNGKFKVCGWQKRATSDAEVIANNKLVQVFYKSGDFSGGQNSASQHDAVFRLIYTVSAKASLDLSVINDSNASDIQRANAITAMLESESLADSYFDELVSLTWQIVKSAQNLNFGIDKTIVKMANQNIKSVYKDEPSRDGSLTVLTGYMDFVCRLVENIDGVTPVIPEFGDDIINIQIFYRTERRRNRANKTARNNVKSRKSRCCF